MTRFFHPHHEDAYPILSDERRLVQVRQLGHVAKGKVLLPKVIQYANEAQDVFWFELGEVLGHIGDPDVDGEYETTYLCDLLKEQDQYDPDQISVGIIDCPLLDELMSGISRECDCVIVSLHNIGKILKQSGSTYEAYILTEIAVQLLTIRYRTEVNLHVDPEQCERPWHRETKACLFDYCDLPEHTGNKLMSPRLCQECSQLLKDAKIPLEVMKSCVAIFNNGIKARYPQILTTLVENPLATALFSGTIGSLLMWIISQGLASLQYSAWWTPLILLNLILVALISYKMFKDFTSKIRF